MIGIFLSLPLWRPYSTRCGCWCLWALEEHKLYRHVTLNKVYRRIAYSLNIAFKGLDPDGSLLANGRVFCLTELKGDWLWHRQIFRFFGNWQQTKNVCYRCSAAGKGHEAGLFFNFWDDQPAWEEFDTGAFFARQLTKPDPCALTCKSRYACMDQPKSPVFCWLSQSNYQEPRPNHFSTRIPSANFESMLYARYQLGNCI